MYLTEDDIQMLNGSLEILGHMHEVLRALPVEMAKRDVKELEAKIRDRYKRKDKKDTKFFDVVAEGAISLGHEYEGHYSLFQKVFGTSGVIITEERGKVGSSRIEGNTPVIISDPTDRSSYLDRLIVDYGSECNTMGEIFARERERIGEARARVEGCNSSVTFLKDNMLKYSVVLNLFTGEVFVAYEPGVFSEDIAKVKSVDDLITKVEFKEEENSTILYFTEPGKYERNRDGTHLRLFPLANIKSPGGPNRFTYLLKETGTEKISPVGVIAHNGEKIQESLPNIVMAFFSKGELAAFKLFCDRNYFDYRGSKPLTPNLQNSIYGPGLLINTGIDLSFLNNHEYPSEFRETTVITPVKNASVMTMMRGMVQDQYAIQII